MKRLIVLILLAVACGCDTNPASPEDCRKDVRCFESPVEQGVFFSKNPNDPCPCADN